MKMIEKAKVFAMAGILAIAGAVAVMPEKVSAYDLSGGATAAKTDDMTDSLPTTVSNIISVVLYAIGIVAVVMMILGGFQYITSSGDAAKVTKAKNTILYGIVGLVIAILAYAIVQFVINGVKDSTGNPSVQILENYEAKELLEHVK